MDRLTTKAQQTVFSTVNRGHYLKRVVINIRASKTISGLVKVSVTSPAGLMKFFLNVEPWSYRHAVWNSIRRETQYDGTSTHVLSARWRSFASVNFVNVCLNHWFCSPVLLLIVVIELRNGTTLVSNMNVIKKLIRPRRSEVPFHC